MSKQLVVHDTTTQTLESLDPMNATGVPLPCWQVVSALPAAGQVAGEAYLVTGTKTGFVWTGTNFVPIVPSALLNYPTDAALLADSTQPPGSYGVSQMTGNLFISMAGGAWHAVGVRSYATETAMKTDVNAVEGDTAWTQDTNQLWYFNAGRWFTLGVHYYATEADLIADQANNAGGTVACAMDTGLLFSCPTQLPALWQPMSIAQFPDEAHMRAKTTDNVAHQIAITQDQNRIYVWTGTAWVGSPVEYFATEAALLASTPLVGTLGIAGDTSKAYVRMASSWQALAGPTMTAGIALPTTGMATGDMFYNITTKTLYVRGATTWDAVSGGATVAATAPTTPQTGQLWYDTTKGELKVWRGTLWAAAYQQIENVGDGSFKISSDSTGLAQIELHNPSSGRHAGIATRSGAGPEFWLQDGAGSTTHTNFMEVAADGAVSFPHGYVDPHTLRGDITLGANAATAQEIILIKGIAPSNESIYIDLADAYTSGERSSYALHVFAAASSGSAPIAPIHFFISTPHFEYFRFFWKDSTDNYCLAAKVMAGNNGVVYHAALRFPNALDSGVTFDGNTVTTSTSGVTVSANQNFSLRLTPRIVAKKDIDHHVYTQDRWEETVQTVTDITKYVPVGNLFKAEIVARAVSYHGGTIYLRSYIEATFGNSATSSTQRAPDNGDATGTRHLYHAYSDVSAAGSLKFHVYSYNTGAGNGDKQVHGKLLVWDLGPSSWIPDFT